MKSGVCKPLLSYMASESWVSRLDFILKQSMCLFFKYFPFHEKYQCSIVNYERGCPAPMPQHILEFPIEQNFQLLDHPELSPLETHSEHGTATSVAGKDLQDVIKTIWPLSWDRISDTRKLVSNLCLVYNSWPKMVDILQPSHEVFLMDNLDFPCYVWSIHHD